MIFPKASSNRSPQPNGWIPRYNDEPDFKFVVIEKFLSVENEFSLKDGLLLKYYFILKALGLSDQQAFGLDKCDSMVEQIPLLYQPISNIRLTRHHDGSSRHKARLFFRSDYSCRKYRNFSPGREGRKRAEIF